MCRVCRALVSAETSLSLLIAGEQLGGLPCCRKPLKQLAVTPVLPGAQSLGRGSSAAEESGCS